MRARADLSKILHTLCDNVYFNSPTNTTMSYPCIRYSLDADNVRMADNKRYVTYGKYTITHIYKTYSNRLYDKIMDAFDFISFDRSYVSDGLYHDVFTLHF